MVAGLVLLLATTEPNPRLTESGVIRRFGGVCLSLERWDLFGWREIGQTYDVSDALNGDWHSPRSDPPCVVLESRVFQVRPPFDAPPDVYRLCGLADEEPCVEWRKVPFTGSPGP